MWITNAVVTVLLEMETNAEFFPHLVTRRRIGRSDMHTAVKT